MAIAVGLGALLLRAAAAWHPTPHSKAPNATAGEELFERAVAAVARTKGAEPKPAPCGPQQQQRRWWEVLPNEK